MPPETDTKDAADQQGDQRSPVQIRQRYDEIAGELRELDDKSEGRPFDDATQTLWDELAFERETLKPIVEKLDERDRLREDVAKRVTERVHGLPEPRKGAEEVFGQDVTRMEYREARNWSLRILNDRESNYILSTAQGDYLERRVRSDSELARRIIVTENDHYRSAWMKCVTQSPPVLTAEENQAMLTCRQFERAAAEGAGTSGGFAIPVFIDPTVILTNQETDNPFLALCRQENITTNAWKGVSAAGVVWAFQTEAATVADNSITLAQPQVNVYMARGFIPFSIEVGEDWPGFQAEMARLLSAGYDELLLNKFTSGSGTSEPRGLLTALAANTNSIVNVATTGAFGYPDVYNVWKSLLQKYRRRASWMMAVDVNNKIRQFGQANVYHAATVTLEAGAAEVLFGKQVYEDPYFPDFTGTTGQNILVVGDFSNYLIARRTGMSVELVPQVFNPATAFPTGQRGWFAYARIGGNSVNDNGFKLLKT
jgi:HK97 family phage major capsid protein